MYGYIYETTCLINKKKYIGQKHGDFTEKYLGSGHYIKDDIKLLGKENFEVKLIEECNTQEELDKREKHWIADLKTNYPIELIYNIADGGQTGWTFGSKHSDITKKRIGKKSRNRSSESNIKISENMKGRVPWNKGKSGIYSEDVIERMRQSAIGRKLSDDTKKKISESQKGRVPWNKGLGKGPYVKKGSQKGFIWVTKNNTTITKRIPKEELHFYIADEWHQGRDCIKGISSKKKGIHLSEEQKSYISQRTKEKMNSPEVKAKLLRPGVLDNLKGKIAVNDGEKRTYINRDELNKYLNNGYKLGYPKKRGDD